MSWPTVPSPFLKLFETFPLHQYPPIPPPAHLRCTPTAPTLWIHPPPEESDCLSRDVECLKWQAYLALTHAAARQQRRIALRWDIPAEGALEGRLPNLHLPSGELIPAHDIPSFEEEDEPEWEGYRGPQEKDESRAWVELLEGVVHAALILATPPPAFSPISLLSAPAPHTINSLLPTPAPSIAVSSLLPLTLPVNLPLPWVSRKMDRQRDSIFTQYAVAVHALSERLGTDKWFLGSDAPTPLDALLFAYLHCILTSPLDKSKRDLREEITKHVNLVAWEWRVRGLVRKGFVPEQVKA
ncbi:hypothetical protein BD626DRAFT_423358 [Schizophyllum amplum]|uniref:Metaxin glutathione S-transferase domain-containing protein n=1 Tax=Schizophyllum amplum TaxID=97359 RepID=A0A550D0C7_9AGAR|nr:hypothetical protein BD626DRAFT_423358 [Auriculariopsis ampla]